MGIRQTACRLVFVWGCSAGLLLWSGPVQAQGPVSGQAVCGPCAISPSACNLTIRHYVLARSIMGPEIEGTGLRSEDCWITEMLNPDDADPLFVDPDADWRLLPESVARQTGPWGLDRGACVPAGAAIWDAPDSTSWPTTVVLAVRGPDIVSCKYALDPPGDLWSEERSVDVPILLDGLEPGYSFRVQVVGKDSAGRWQSRPTSTETWAVPNN